MEGLSAKLNDLRDEILLISKKLNNVEVLYSFIGVNKLVRDSIFTNHLTMTRCSSNGSFDRFCSQILPSIHHKIKWLDIESSFMEDVLLCTSYPYLCGLGLHNFDKDIALHIFIDHKEGQCHTYSYLSQAKYYEYITNNFPGGLFKYVREVSLYDERPFEHEFLVKIAKSFPFMERLTVYNDKPQKKGVVVGIALACQIYSH
ncbi:unnamed protein product [Rotaria magnacalcarata]|uniref:Uncharacterized protein n=1 Tax=Rotaria magnacalcarata TaxID=392030 RepID=A0A815YZT7_9BILA|nr:unnamed protein product [Rotaria magnacalcarata]